MRRIFHLVSYMKFKIIHFKIENVSFGLEIFKLIFAIQLALANIACATSAVNFQKIFPKNGCYTVVFHQKRVFEGEEENYNGTLRRLSPDHWKVVYYTNPPFLVSAKGNLITLGYEGDEKETFDRREYKNPVLELLFHLDHLGDIFEIKPLDGNRYLLIPKGELSQYVEKAILQTDPNGNPRRIEVFGGGDNYLVIDILKIEPACGGDKIGKP